MTTTLLCPFCHSKIESLPHHCAEGRIRLEGDEIVIERVGMYGYGYEEYMRIPKDRFPDLFNTPPRAG